MGKLASEEFDKHCFSHTSHRHLEGASGVLAMVKAIMMLKKGTVLPTAGFEKINPKIEGHEKIKIAEMPLPWPENEQRRCVVTNFGELDLQKMFYNDLIAAAKVLVAATLQSSWKLHRPRPYRMITL